MPEAIQTLPRDGPVHSIFKVDVEDRGKLTGMTMSLPEGKVQNISQVS